MLLSWEVSSGKVFWAASCFFAVDITSIISAAGLLVESSFNLVMEMY